MLRLIAPLLVLILIPSTIAESVYRLRAGNLTVEIAAATDALHADFGPRFDRTAYVRQVTLGTHTFLDRPGLCDEFGLLGTGVLGFTEAGPTETFLKIGVGRLIRGTGETYRFSERYPLAEAFPTEVTATTSTVTTRQQAPVGERWSYAYTKVYHLSPEGRLTLRYTLANTGTETYSFEHYNHHWFSFSSEPSGPAYRIRPEFSGPTTESSTWTFAHGRLHPSAPLPARGGIHWAWDDVTGPAAATLEHSVLPHRVAFRGDFPLARFASWANAQAISPELFHRVTLRPGESATWSMTYTFSAEQ